MGKKSEKIVSKFQKRLEKNPTKQEVKLKNFLTKRHIYFEFQKMVKGESGKWYIPDFLLPQFGVIIEVDGSHHYNNPKQYEKDRQRTFDLEKMGFKVLRLRNKDIMDLSKNDLTDLINRKFENYIPSIYYVEPSKQKKIIN